MSDISTLVSHITDHVYTFSGNKTICVSSVQDFFSVEAILKEEGFSNLLKKQITAIEHLEEKASSDQLQLLLESIDAQESNVIGVEDDFETPLIEYLLSYPKVVTKNYFGVREIFEKEGSTVYIIKLYLLRSQIEDEFTTISHYAFSKVFKYLSGKSLAFPKGMNKEGFMKFWEEHGLTDMISLTVDNTFSQAEIDYVFETYEQEESKHNGEALLDDTQTQKEINKVYFSYLEQAKQTEEGLFAVSKLDQDEVENRLGLIAKYIGLYLEQIKQQDTLIQDLMILNDFDTVVNASLMIIKSHTNKEELKKEIELIVTTLDEKKSQMHQDDSKERLVFFEEYTKQLLPIISKIQ